VADLREIGTQRSTILDSPRALFGESTKSGKTGPASPFSPSAKAQLSSDDWIPPELTNQQLDDLVAFLNTL
jgi:hypothetical protein